MNITLIGMPGVGKSAIGKQLAKELDYKFIEVDDIIKREIKLKLQQIINNFGEKKFMKIEEKSILELGKINNCIISPGGSVIYSEKAMRFLKKRSVIVFLNDSIENIQKRILDLPSRGIVGLKEKNLKILFNKRLNLYNKYSDISIRVPKNFGVVFVVKKILQKLKLENLK